MPLSFATHAMELELILNSKLNFRSTLIEKDSEYTNEINLPKDDNDSTKKITKALVDLKFISRDPKSPELLNDLKKINIKEISDLAATPEKDTGEYVDALIQ